ARTAAGLAAAQRRNRWTTHVISCSHCARANLRIQSAGIAAIRAPASRKLPALINAARLLRKPLPPPPRLPDPQPAPPQSRVPPPRAAREELAPRIRRPEPPRRELRTMGFRSTPELHGSCPLPSPHPLLGNCTASPYPDRAKDRSNFRPA